MASSKHRRAPKPTRVIDRATLVQTVTGLSPSDLARVVAFIHGAAAHISRHGTVPEQAAELIRWAESSAGPGLTAIQRALENFRYARRVDDKEPRRARPHLSYRSTNSRSESSRRQPLLSSCGA